MEDVASGLRSLPAPLGRRPALTPEAPLLSRIPAWRLSDLHGRASEAARPHGCLRDSAALTLRASLSGDLQRVFGAPNPRPAVRAGLFDRALRGFLERWPNGQILSLGEALETSAYRVPAPRARWVIVDLPAVLVERERALPPAPNHHHVGRSVLDRGWFREIDPERPTFVSGQGLASAHDAALVRRLLVDLVDRLERALIVLDVCASSAPPRMAWAEDPDPLRPRAAAATLRGWLSDRCSVEVHPWNPSPRGAARWIGPLARALPGGVDHPRLARVTKDQPER